MTPRIPPKATPARAPVSAPAPATASIATEAGQERRRSASLPPQRIGRMPIGAPGLPSRTDAGRSRDELTGHVLTTPALTGLLHDADLVSLGRTNRWLRESTAPERAARERLRQAAQALVDTPVASGHQLRQRLGGAAAADPPGTTVHSLPEHLRAAPLVALGSDLLQLSAPDRRQAIQDLLDFPVPDGEHPILADLRMAAQAGEAGLVAREGRLTAQGGAARTAVEQGQNVHAVARRFGVGGDDAVGSLMSAALPRARQALEQGDTLSAVTRRLGISGYLPLMNLHMHSLTQVHRLTGEEMVLASRHNEPIDRFRGDPHHGAVETINQMRALRSVNSGENVGQAAHRFGIDAADASRLLEPHAAAALMSDGRRIRSPIYTERIADLVQQRGIQQPGLITRLERLSIDSRAPVLLRGGQPPEAVAEQLGVSMPEHLDLLRRMADEAHHG